MSGPRLCLVLQVLGCLPWPVLGRSIALCAVVADCVVVLALLVVRWLCCQGMRNLVARCLQKDPQHRPTARELLEDKFFKVGSSSSNPAHGCRTGTHDWWFSTGRTSHATHALLPVWLQLTALVYSCRLRSGFHGCFQFFTMRFCINEVHWQVTWVVCRPVCIAASA